MSSSPIDKVANAAGNLEKRGEAELDTMVKQDFDTTESNARYAAYGRSITRILRSSTRYVAYTSDIGESFRPVVPPWIVTAGYGVSWAYLLGDVTYETYKARQQGPTPLEAANFSEPTRLSMYAVKRGVFQAVASMALPALTIHSAVKQSSKMLANHKSSRVRIWGPTATGLAIVPLLPFLFDHPVEYAVDFIFDKVEHALQTVKEVPSAASPIPAGPASTPVDRAPAKEL